MTDAATYYTIISPRILHFCFLRICFFFFLFIHFLSRTGTPASPPSAIYIYIIVYQCVHVYVYGRYDIIYVCYAGILCCVYIIHVHGPAGQETLFSVRAYNRLKRLPPFVEQTSAGCSKPQRPMSAQ